MLEWEIFTIPEPEQYRNCKPIQYIVTKNGCWACISHFVTPYGYPKLKRNGKWCNMGRYIYEISKGSIPQGMHVLHSCDNRLCINPSHLSIGTHQENMAQKSLRGRASKKLSLKKAKQIIDLLQAGVLTQKEIAAKFNVTTRAVRRIKMKEHWKGAYNMRTPMLCPVDVGYGYNKPYRQTPIPSVVAKTTVKKFLDGQDAIEFGNPSIISMDDGHFAVGNTALKITKTPQTIMEGNKRWKTIEYKALMLYAISQQLPAEDGNYDVYLVTGLPYLQSQNEDEINGLKDTFQRKFKIATIEEGKPVSKNINIVRVDVLSQPRGAYYALVPLTARKIKGELALLADLGFKSLDYLLLENGQETEDSNGEDAIAGMERIYNGLLRELRGAGAPPIPIHEVDNWIDRGYLKKYDLNILKHFDSAAKKIVDDMKDKLGATWNRLEAIGTIYFVGGSAQRLKPFLEGHLKGMRVMFVENSQQLIVEGYAAYGRAMSRKLWGDA